jgi:NADPH:quinone reductase-like Zn-dependent oxidoreductase
VVAIAEGSHYALSFIRKAKVCSGQDVLVNGVTGAVGSAAVQLLKQLGARLTAVCGPEHLELVKGLGADRVIDYTGQDFTRDTQRYDVVLVLTFITPLGGGRKIMMNLGRDDPQMASYFREVLESGACRPLVDRRYQLEEIVEAHRYVETGRKIGNVVISIEPST